MVTEETMERIMDWLGHLHRWENREDLKISGKTRNKLSKEENTLLFKLLGKHEELFALARDSFMLVVKENPEVCRAVQKKWDAESQKRKKWLKEYEQGKNPTPFLNFPYTDFQ